MRTEEERSYRSLGEMRRRKRQLKSEIAASEKVVGRMWKGLFPTKKNKRGAAKAHRFSNIVSTSLAVGDGVLLAWKLYRRFRK